VLVEKENKTAIFSTHSIQEAEELGDRIAIMDKGLIKACGNINDLKADGGSLFDIYSRVTSGDF